MTEVLGDSMPEATEDGSGGLKDREPEHER